MATTTYLRPGSFVEEKLLPVQPTAGPAAPPAALFGTNKRGPIVPTKAPSWTEYTRLFGEFNGNDVFPHGAFQFFNQSGGGVGYFCRVVGTGAATSTRTFNDSQGVPVAALKVDAANPGVWGDTVYIDISAGTVVTGDTLFNLVVHYGSAAADTVVERWMDVSMDPSSARYVAAIVNGKSAYIVVAKNALNVTHTVPATIAGAVLAGGVDGAAPTALQWETAVRQLDAIPEPVILALPGVTAAATINPIIVYAAAREDVFYVPDPPQGTSNADVITWAGTLTPASSYGAVYYPWPSVVDPSSLAPNATRYVPPSALVVGKMVANDLARGVFKAPAGIETVFSGVVGTERYLSNDDRDDLNSAHVNALITLPNIGTVIYGARTLRKTLEADRYVNVRRTLIYLKRAFKDLTAFAVFENNDAVLWSKIRSVLSTFLTGFWQAGGLEGDNAAAAFFVKCDAEINTDETVGQGYLYTDVGVAPQFPAEFIVIRLGQFQGNTTATELTA